MSETENTGEEQVPSAPLNVSEPNAIDSGDTSTMGALRNEISKALLGQEEVLEQSLIALLAAGHVLLEGVPGLGKTLLVTAMARAMHCNFSRVQFTPDLMPSDVVGHTVYDSSTGSFRLKRGPAFTNLLLADEINRAPARTQSSLLEVMQERQITIDGNTNLLDEPFMVFATQNPIEQEGTYPLPEAQLDRFLLKVVMDYPTEEQEYQVVQSVTEGRTGGQFVLQDVVSVAGPEEIAQAQHEVANLHVEEAVARYAVSLCRATRKTQGLSVGAGPRGAIALVRTARAKAYLSGRDFVVPDDIHGVALPALRHRVMPAPELALDGRTSDSILLEILDQVPAPRA